jgi:hypothetical protein
MMTEQMMSKNKITSMCQGKVKHASKEQACIVATKAKNVLMNVYLCPFCKSWHTGKTRDKARGAQRIDQLLARDKREQNARIETLKSHYQKS